MNDFLSKRLIGRIDGDVSNANNASVHQIDGFSCRLVGITILVKTKSSVTGRSNESQVLILSTMQSKEKRNEETKQICKRDDARDRSRRLLTWACPSPHHSRFLVPVLQILGKSNIQEPRAAQMPSCSEYESLDGPTKPAGS